MNAKMIIEAVGYIGSALVLISFLMASVVKLRLINTAGSVVSAIYALIIHAYPTLVMNVCLAVINIHYLRRLRRMEKRTYDMVPVKADDAYLAHCLAKYGEDMKKCFPGMNIRPSADDEIFLIFCDDALAGITFGKMDGETFRMEMDYATPAFRDLTVGKFLTEHLAERGVKELSFAGSSEAHESYLKKMGYTKENGVYTKRIG